MPLFAGDVCSGRGDVPVAVAAAAANAANVTVARNRLIWLRGHVSRASILIACQAAEVCRRSGGVRLGCRSGQWSAERSGARVRRLCARKILCGAERAAAQKRVVCLLTGFLGRPPPPSSSRKLFVSISRRQSHKLEVCCYIPSTALDERTEPLAIRVVRTLLLAASLLTLFASVALLSISCLTDKAGAEANATASGQTDIVPLVESGFLLLQALFGLYVSLSKSEQAAMAYAVVCVFNALAVIIVLTVDTGIFAQDKESARAAAVANMFESQPSRPYYYPPLPAGIEPLHEHLAIYRGDPDNDNNNKQTSNGQTKRFVALQVILWTSVAVDLTSAFLSFAMLALGGLVRQVSGGSTSSVRVPAKRPTADSLLQPPPPPPPIVRQSPQPLPQPQQPTSKLTPSIKQPVEQTTVPIQPPPQLQRQVASPQAQPSPPQPAAQSRHSGSVAAKTRHANMAKRAGSRRVQKSAAPNEIKPLPPPQRVEATPYTYQPVHVIPSESANLLKTLKRPKVRPKYADKSICSLESAARALTRTGSSVELPAQERRQ